MIHRSSRLWNGTTRCLASLLLLSLTSCAPFPAQAPDMAPTGTKVARIGDGPARATVHVSQAAYKALATAHRWTLDDVHTVTLTLLVRNTALEFVPLDVPMSVTLDLKANPGTTSAAFTELAHGYYRVQVTAYGDPNGDPASPALNSPPATVDLDLVTAYQAEVAATLTLDADTVDTTGTIRATAPTNDGGYLEPTEPETVGTAAPEDTATEATVN